jgi:hypothetical protein
LVEAFGSVPKTIFIAVGAYSGGFGGTLLSQAPAKFGNSDNDIEVPEYQPLATSSIRDEDLDGKFDVGTPEMLVSVNGNETDGNYGLRRFYLDEVAGDATERFELRITGKTETRVNFEFFGITGKVYTIEESADLRTWKTVPLATTTGGTAAPFYQAVAVGRVPAEVAAYPGASRFYRLTAR